jgi:hypothetical protein
MNPLEHNMQFAVVNPMEHKLAMQHIDPGSYRAGAILVFLAAWDSPHGPT